MKNFYKAVTVVTCASVMLSGCSLLDKGIDEEEIIDVTEGICSTIKSGKYNKIKKLVVDDDELDTVEAMLNLYMMDELLETIEYEIDEDSIKEKKDKVEISVEFTFADVYDINDNGPYYGSDELIDYIAEADTASEEYTFTLVNDDGEWLLEDASTIVDIYENFEDFNPVEAIVDPDDLIDIDYSDAYWWFADNDGNYENTGSIDLEVYIDSAETWECEYEGQVIASGSGTDAWVHSSDVSIDIIDDYYFPAGTYTITFYDANGDVVYSDSTTVTCTYTSTATPTPTNSDYVTLPGTTSTNVLVDNQTTANSLQTGLTAPGYTYISPMYIYGEQNINGDLEYYLADVFCIVVGDPTIVNGGTSLTVVGEYYENSVYMMYDANLSMAEILEIYIGENDLYQESYAEDYGSAASVSNDGETVTLWKIDELGYIGKPGSYMIQCVSYTIESVNDETTVDAMLEWADMAAFDESVVDGL